jgi:hypothetical protein
MFLLVFLLYDDGIEKEIDMNGITEIFRKMIQESWMPKAILDKKYKLYEHVEIAFLALLAMAED